MEIKCAKGKRIRVSQKQEIALIVQFYSDELSVGEVGLHFRNMQKA